MPEVDEAVPSDMKQDASQTTSQTPKARRGRKKANTSTTMPSAIVTKPTTDLSEIPIFSAEFIEHSKSREQESRQLRKEVNELEQQNGVLQKHIEGLKKSSQNVQVEIDFYSKHNDELKRYIHTCQEAILDGFQSSPIPNTHQGASLDNLDDFVRKLTSYASQVKETPELDHEFVAHLRTVIEKMKIKNTDTV